MDKNGYALVILHKPVSKSSDGQRHFDLIELTKNNIEVFTDKIFSKVPKTIYETKKTIVRGIDTAWSADILDWKLTVQKILVDLVAFLLY